MNIKSILLSALGAALILTIALTLDTEKKYNSYFAKAKAEKSVKEAAEAQGSFDFFQEMRANPLTGNIEAEDIEDALRQVKINRNNVSKTTALPNLEWQERGPDNIGGRTRALQIDVNNPSKLYMGQVTGGFWSSTDGGDTWSGMAGFDSSTRMSVSTITQAPNGDIYYGTGESFADISGTGMNGSMPGGGIFKSTDGGLTASLLPATKPAFDNTTGIWSYINRLASDPNDANHIYAALGRGFYETKNGGTTWTPIVASIPMLDVSVSTNGNVVLASSGSQMFLSVDGGANFTLGINSTSRGLPGSSGINRIEVAVAPSNENYLYCVMSTGGQTKGIYRSTDKGQNWTVIGQGGSQAFNPLGDQGGYNIALGVHPTNPELIFVGGQLDLYRFDGATSVWQPIAYWVKSSNSVSGGTYVHADMHGIEFSTSNPNEMYVLTDGGFFKTTDCTVPTPFFVEKNKNYATAQCYGVAANSLGHIIFGTQDNGTNLINGSVQNSPNQSKDAMGGDGMRGAASDINTNFLFGTSQLGVLRVARDGGSSTAAFQSAFDKNIDNLPLNNADGSPDEGGPWISPVTLQENFNGTVTKSVLFIGLNNNVWFSQNAVSPESNIWFPLHTRTGARYSAIALSDDGSTAFVGTSGGQVYRITNIDLFGTKYVYDDTVSNLLTDGFAQDSNFVTTQITGPWSGQITDLECNATGSELLITTPRYGVANHVFRSTNALAPTPTVTSIQGVGAGRLPSMPVYSAAILSQPNSYLVGTDLGVWGTDNGGASWTELNNIATGPEAEWHPRAAVLQIAVKPFLNGTNGYYAGDVIYTGTYGRGTFLSTTLATQWPTTTKDFEQAAANRLNIYPNPVNTVATINYNATKAGEGMIKVTSLNGRVIKSTFADLQIGENKLSVDLSTLSKGVYMVSLSSSNGVVTSKVVKR